MPANKRPQQQLQRVSPGVYRGPQGNLVQSPTGKMPLQQNNKPMQQGQQQAPAAQPQFANAQNRLDTLNNQIASSGQGPTAQQQATIAELQRRSNIAANNPAPTGNQVTPTLGGLNQGAQDLAATGTGYALDQLQTGEFANPFQAQLADRIGQEDLEGFRQNTYDQQYGYLTRDLGQQEQLAGQDVAQGLADRGIPYSADPNSRYQQEMKDYNNRFDRARGDARAQANQFAGQEMQRYFGINEQTRANQASEQYQQRNQRLGEIGTLSGVGMQNVTTLEGLKDVDAALKQQKKLQIMALNKQGSGGGSAPANPNPFEGL